MHCILQTEDKRDSDRTEEMEVCSLLGGYWGSSNHPAGVTLGAVGVLELPQQRQFAGNLSHLNYDKLPQTRQQMALLLPPAVRD